MYVPTLTKLLRFVKECKISSIDRGNKLGLEKAKKPAKLKLWVFTECLGEWRQWGQGERSFVKRVGDCW